MTSSHFTVEHDILKFVTQRYLWNLGRVEVELKFLLSDIERPVLIAVRVYLLHKNIGSCTLQNVKMILDRQFWRISLFPCNLNTLSWFLNTSKISALIEFKFWHGYLLSASKLFLYNPLQLYCSFILRQAITIIIY